MPVQQLDLFGSPLRPPKKIREDEAPPAIEKPSNEAAKPAQLAEDSYVVAIMPSAPVPKPESIEFQVEEIAPIEVVLEVETVPAESAAQEQEEDTGLEAAPEQENNAIIDNTEYDGAAIEAETEVFGDNEADSGLAEGLKSGTDLDESHIPYSEPVQLPESKLDLVVEPDEELFVFVDEPAPDEIVDEENEAINSFVDEPAAEIVDEEEVAIPEKDAIGEATGETQPLSETESDAGSEDGTLLDEAESVVGVEAPTIEESISIEDNGPFIEEEASVEPPLTEASIAEEEAPSIEDTPATSPIVENEELAIENEPGESKTEETPVADSEAPSEEDAPAIDEVLEVGPSSTVENDKIPVEEQPSNNYELTEEPFEVGEESAIEDLTAEEENFVEDFSLDENPGPSVDDEISTEAIEGEEPVSDDEKPASEEASAAEDVLEEDAIFENEDVSVEDELNVEEFAEPIETSNETNDELPIGDEPSEEVLEEQESVQSLEEFLPENEEKLIVSSDAFAAEEIFEETAIDDLQELPTDAEIGNPESPQTKPKEKKSTTEIAGHQRGRKPIQDYEDELENLNIPADEELFKRQYYSMRETAAMFGVNQSLLRFWENEFAILQPKKNKKGDRYFRPADIKNLVLIYHLLRVRKFTMEGAKEYLQSNKKAGDTFELTRRLEKLKSFLLELKASL